MDIMKEVMRMAREVDEELMPLLNVGSHERLRQAVNHLPQAGGKRMRKTAGLPPKGPWSPGKRNDTHRSRNSRSVRWRSMDRSFLARSSASTFSRRTKMW